MVPSNFADYAMNYIEATDRQPLGNARLMRSATVETCDCLHKPRRLVEEPESRLIAVFFIQRAL